MDSPLQATANPALGVLIFTLGGLAGAVFYLPFKKVKNWAWESYWLVYAVVGLIVVPWALALSTSPNVVSVLRATPQQELVFCFLCGAMWGVGGLTWGLMIRYLGVGLGLAIGAGPDVGGGHADPQGAQGRIPSALRARCRHHVARRGRRVTGGHRAGRPGRHVQGERAARRGEEEDGRRVRLQERDARCRLLGLDERRHELRAPGRPGNREAGPDHCAGHVPNLERHARARRRPAGRLRGQCALVPVPQRQEQDDRRLSPERLPRWPSISDLPAWRERSGALSSFASRRASPRWARWAMWAGRC